VLESHAAYLEAQCLPRYLKPLAQHENGPMRLHVLCECDGHMQESAPCLSASSLVRLGECPASRVEDCGKHSNVRLKMIIISLTHIHRNAIFYLFDRC
jgi:hypothetical protein